MARQLVKINTNPVAQHYADEKIIEFSSPNGGGLIAFRLTDDGELLIEPYRLDDTVRVNLADNKPTEATEAEQADDPARGQLQVRVTVDHDFDRAVPDFAEEIREETARALASGDMEVYDIVLLRLHCGARDCPHHETIGSMGATVTSGIWEGAYTVSEALDGIEADDHEKLTEIVREILPEDYRQE